MIKFLIPLVALACAGCESTKTGGPLSNYRPSKRDEMHEVARQGAQQQIIFSKGANLNAYYYADKARRIVFRGDKVASVPEEIKQAVVELEILYCETMIEHQRLLFMPLEIGESARQEYLQKTAAKVGEESYQRYATAAASYSPEAYVDDRARNKLKLKCEELKSRADEALENQAKVVNLLAKHGIQTLRVFRSQDGPKQVVLPM